MTNFVTILVILSVICWYGTDSAPAHSAPSCIRRCPSTNKGNRLNYLLGNQYEYDFNTNVAIRLTDKDLQEVKVQVEGKASISALPECQYALELHDVQVYGSDNSKKLLNDVSRVVRFTLSDDKLEPEICTSKDESPFALNLKRGIISILQIRLKDEIETDVFGTCPTSFKILPKADGGQQIVKTRDLNQCSDRELLANGLVRGIFNKNSRVKTTPLLTGDYTSELQLSQAGIIESAQVTEEYTLVPFTNGDAGAKAHVVTKLQLKSTKPGAPKVSADGLNVPKPLTFENVEKIDPNSQKSAQDILHSLAGSHNVDTSHASKFTELIRVMRQMKKDDLLTLHRDSAAHKKFFLDALFRVGTSESVAATAELLQNKALGDELSTRLASLSFSLATSVSKETLQTLVKLLEVPQLPRETYLGVGNLIKKYNEKNPGHREDLKPVYDKLATVLHGCKKSGGKIPHRQEDKIVSVLKGIRNSNVLLNSVIDRLIICSSELQTTRIRVAAIQALGAESCDKTAQTTALNILKNKNEDSEVRIEAYLIVAQCPNSQIAAELNGLLENEESLQVGSFITSHLANLRSSVDPSRERARQELSNVKSSKKYPWDLRGTSLNSELSYAADSLGVGGVADTNIIYSQQSFIPRSVRTNLTGSVFGTAFNFLELNLRQENLDLVLEHYFGPKGLWKTTNKGELISNLMKKLHTSDGKAKHKRDLSNDVRDFEKNTNWHSQAVNDDRDLDLDLSIKLFGSDLLFLSLNNTLPSDGKGFEQLLKNGWQTLLNDAKKGWKIDVHRHALLLDADFVYPTALGVPIKLQSQGAATLRLQAEVQADLRAIIRNPKQTSFKIRVEPNWDIELTGSLVADAYLVATGLQVVGNVHSSVGTTINFNLADEGRKVSIVTDFPQKKQQILSLDHKVQFITQELGRQTVANSVKSKAPKTPSNDHCFDQLNPITGVTLCLKYSSSLFNKESNVANSVVFPLNGPNAASLWLDIEPKYSLEAQYDDKTSGRRALVITANTPGSKTNRKSSLILEAQIEPKVLARIVLESPIKSASAEVGIEKSDAEISVYGKAESGKDRVSGKIGFKKNGGGPRIEYAPVIELDKGKGQENINYKVSGKLIVDKSKPPKLRYEFQQLHLETPADSSVGPLTLDGYLEHNGPNQIDTNLKLQHRGQSADIAVIYQNDERGLNLDVGVINNVNELLNGRVILKNIVQSNEPKLHAARSLTLIYGKDRESREKRVEISNDFDREVDENQRLKSLDTRNKLLLGFVPLTVALDLSGNNKRATYAFSLESNKNKVKSNFDGRINEKKSGDWNVALSVQANNQEVSITSVRDIVGNGDKSVIKTNAKVSSGASADLNIKYDHIFTKRHANVNIDGSLKLGNDQPPLTLNLLLIAAPKNAKSNGKIINAGKELVSFDANVERNVDDVDAPVKGSGHIKIDDLIIAEWTVNSVKGNGNADLIVELPKNDRKVKLGSTFEHGPNKCNVLVELFYNFQKNDKERIALKTSNSYQDKSLTSDNEVDVNGEKIQLNFSIKRTGDARKGTVNGEARLRTPTNREITLTLRRDIDLVAPKGSGTGNIKLTDTIKTGGIKVRSIELQGDLKDAVGKENLFHAIHKLTLTGFEGKTLVIDTDVKHLPHGKYKTAGTSVSVSGTAIPNSLSLVANIDEYCPIHAIFQISAKHGTDVQLNLNGKYELGDQGGKPSSYSLRGSLDLPQTNLRRVSFDTNGNYKLPAPNDKNGLHEYSISLNGDLNGKQLSISSDGKGNDLLIDSNLNIKVPDVDPLSASVKLEQNGLWLDESADSVPRTANGNVLINYGNGKIIQFKGDVNFIETKSLDLKAELHTPYEKAKSLVLLVKENKIQENEYTSEAELTVDGNKYRGTGESVLSAVNPKININFYAPNNKHTQISLLSNRVGDQKHKTAVRLVDVLGHDLTLDADISYQSIESFNVVLDVDSVSLKINKVHVDVTTKNDGGNKVIQFRATEQGKEIVSGSGEITVKNERGKTTIGGSGNVKWQDKPGVANFYLTQTVLEEATNKETGIMYTLNGQIGEERKLNADLKLSNKNVQVHCVVCGNQKPCLNVAISSELTKAELNDFKHGFTINVNLIPLGATHELLIKSETAILNRVFTHESSIDLKSADDKKYSYSMIIAKPTSKIVLQIPSREVSIEANYRIPQKEWRGQYEVGISTYWNKKRDPTKVSRVAVSANVHSIDKTGWNVDSELIISHPSMKELRVIEKSKLANNEYHLLLEYDVFQQTDQKIVIDVKNTLKANELKSVWSLTSRGLGINYRFNQDVKASWDRAEFLFHSNFVGPTAADKFALNIDSKSGRMDAKIIAFNDELISATSIVDSQQRIATVSSRVKLLGVEPIEAKAELRGLKSASATIKQGNFLDVKAIADREKEVSIVIIGENKKLLDAKVALNQENLLKTTSQVNENEIKNFITSAKNRLAQDGERSKKELEARLNNLKNSITKQINDIKAHVIDTSSVNQDLKNELQKISDEILAEKSIKNLVELYNKTFKPVIKALGEILKTLSAHFEQTSKVLNDLGKQLYESYTEKIQPALKQTLTNIESILRTIYEELYNIAITWAEKLYERLKEIDLTELNKAISKLINQLSKTFGGYLELISNEISEIYELILDQLRALPGLDTIKEKLKELYNTALPNINIEETIVDLYEKLKKEIKSWLRMIPIDLNDLSASNIIWGLPVPSYVQRLATIPPWTGVKFSVWNLLRNERLPSIQELIYANGPLDLTSIVPPFNKHAQIVDGTQVFTFNGNQLDLQGNCQYVLAQDVVDGNFSIVAQIVDKKLKSISIIDKSGESLQVNNDGKVLKNNKPTDLPVLGTELFAHRSFHSVHLLSLYGVRIHCTPNLNVCHLVVNGYYHNKLRGILGNANGEPKGDLQLPNAKFADSISGFVNAFKLQATCPDIQVPDKHDHTQDGKTAECTAVFGLGSSLRYCALLIDPTDYELACNHAVKSSANKQQTACSIALGYTSLCRLHGIPVSLPSKCVKCSSNDENGAPKNYEIGDSYELKAPIKKADVVLVVDKAIEQVVLTELVQTTIDDLRRELKTRGIADVHIGVIGYKRGEKYTQLLTSDGQLNIKKFHIPVQEKDNELLKEGKISPIGCEHIDPALVALEQLRLRLLDDLQLSADARAFQLAIDAPFRASASKVVIAIRSDILTKSNNPLKALGVNVVDEVARIHGVTVHLISPVSGLALNNNKDAKGIVGFNAEKVLQLNGKAGGNADLRGHIVHDPDLGIEIVEGKNNGYILDLNNYKSLDDKNRKKFLSVATQAIADQIEHTEYKNLCRCSLHDGIVAQEKCSVISRDTKQAGSKRK